ncbi:MAG: radical SAM protein [Ignavibacteria bacterium]
MKKLEVGIIDLVSKKPNRKLFARIMNANFASIMPQVIGVWSEEEGHNVTYICYTGKEDLISELPQNVDIVFIGAFTESAQTAYALSNLLRSRGAITVLGGPHARCYPDDALNYFDYVAGFTDKNIILEILQDCTPHRPFGLYFTSKKQPASLPGVKERWKFIEPTLKKAPFLKLVPMLGSLGCPYTCSFCIDSTVAYQPLDFNIMKEDLKFLLTKFKKPVVGWHDPNFGIRFNDYMNAIEEAIPENSIDFIAESSLSVLSEPHVKVLKRNGFKAMLPGIESWYDLGNKSKTGSATGMDKVKLASEHVNMILRYLPYVQTNFVLGLDCDKGEEPFELSKIFVDLTPGAFPGYSLLSAFGEAAPLNLDYQEHDRVLPFPFHFLDNNHAMNVKPVNYSWQEFYSHIIGLGEHTFSWAAIAKRMIATKAFIPRWMNVVRAISEEGFGRVAYNKEILVHLKSDKKFRDYFEQKTNELPDFYLNMIKKELDPLWEWLPEGAVFHDQNAYFKKQPERIAV